MDFASFVKQGATEYISDSSAISEAGYCTCFAVADGRDSRGAAQLAVQSIISDFERTKAITKSSIKEFLGNADTILRVQEPPLSASAAILLTDGEVAVWGSIGDCRVYHLRDNLLYDITPDDSDAYALYAAGEIRYPKIRKNAARHSLSRVLGGEAQPEFEFSQPQKLRPGDSMLICTDGFWSSIHERKIEKALKKSSSAQNWLDIMVKTVEKNVSRQKYSRLKDSMCAITVRVRG